MTLAEPYLKQAGYDVKDCSSSESFDFEAKQGGTTIKVEVKGTTSDTVDAVLMTSNEVALHQKEHGATALIIASRIRLSQSEGKYSADVGEVEALIGWNISE